MLVLLIANLDRNSGLVNGSVGKIVGFLEMKDESLPRAQTTKKPSQKSTGQVIMASRSNVASVLYDGY